MIPAIVMTAAVGLGFGVTELLDLEVASPGSFVVVALFANAGLALGRTLRSRASGLNPVPEQRMISVVEQTMPHLRLGLNAETAERTVRLLHDAMRLEAVGIADGEQLLAFVGPGADHHSPGLPIANGLERRAVEYGELVAGPHSQLECGSTNNGSCPLQAAIIAPLKCGDHAVGSLSVYQTSDPEPDPGLVALTRGIAAMLSLQLELAQAHRDGQMADIAKLDALRAQINPHFLFNTLNTITMKARTDPEEARRLLVRLSDFLRYAMQGTGHLASFGEEYFFVRTYLFLEKARFGDQLEVRYDVDPQVLSIPVPVLAIQPLVENAVKHGTAPKEGGGRVELRATLDPVARLLRIRVCDDGVGIEPARIAALLAPAQRGGALANIRERLIRLYGGRASVEVDSAPGRGTTVTLSLPVT